MEHSGIQVSGFSVELLADADGNRVKPTDPSGEFVYRDMAVVDKADGRIYWR